MRKSLPNKDVSHQVRPNTKENYYPELEANKKKTKKQVLLCKYFYRSKNDRERTVLV